MKKLLEGLNPEQRLAVETTEGPVLVLAGAGSGKTRVITVRIAHLLQKKVAPENVLAMTFTNKAAREMRERVASIVGKKRAEKVFVGTFHAFCLNALREHGAEVGFADGFSICDSSDQISTLRGVLRDVQVGGVSMQPGALQSRISLFKNRLATSEQVLEGASDDTEELIGRAWRKYDESLRRTRSLDFDDLLLYTVRLLKKPAVRKLYAERYKYVLVDEYQDTNGPQYEMLRAIAGGHRNLCVVGDDDQSIYGWRGADVSKILGFEKDFPGAKVVRLETNYRSTEQILGAANKVIANNPDRHEKALRSALGPGEPVRGVVAEDEAEEADHVAREIAMLVSRRAAVYSEFAVLFRTGTQPRAFEAQFRARGIPYVLVGGMSFFDRKEVRDVLAYLKLLTNPNDETSLLRIVNAPPRGIGKTSLDRILQFASDNGLSVTDGLARAGEAEGVRAAAAEAAAGLRNALATVANQAATLPLPRAIERLIEVVGYKTEVERTYPDAMTQEQRWGAVSEILDFAENHARRRKDATLASFLQELALTANDDETSEDPGKRNAVTLMTLHASKGLEYPRVYLVGLEEGLLPHVRAVAEDGVEEERRLMYVGITRAQRHLTLCHAKHRSRGGHRVETNVSRFLFELKGESPPPEWRAAGAESPPPSRAKKKAKKRRAKRRTTARRR